ncbi:MAG TPA: hypothetical protein VGE52_05815 [Pirellulales bacterium]
MPRKTTQAATETEHIVDHEIDAAAVATAAPLDADGLLPEDFEPDPPPPAPTLSEITLQDVMKAVGHTTPANLEFGLGIPANVVEEAIRSHAFSMVRGDRSLDADDVVAWVKRAEIPVTPHPEVIAVIRRIRGEYDLAYPKPEPVSPAVREPIKPAKSADDDVTFADLFDPDQVYAFTSVENLFGVVVEELVAARDAGDIQVAPERSAVLGAELLAWLERTGRTVEIPYRTVARVKGDRARGLAAWEAFQKDKAEAEAAALRERLELAKAKAAKRREREAEAAAEAERQAAMVEYVAILNRAGSPKPSDATRLAEIRSAYRIKDDQFAEDAATVARFAELQRLAVTAPVRGIERGRLRNAIKDMEAKFAAEVAQAKQRLSEATNAVHEAENAPNQIRELAMKRPHLFEAGDGSRLLGQN